MLILTSTMMKGQRIIKITMRITLIMVKVMMIQEVKRVSHTLSPRHDAG